MNFTFFDVDITSLEADSMTLALNSAGQNKIQNSTRPLSSTIIMENNSLEYSQTQGYYETTSTYYIYDGLSVMEEYDENGVCTAQYICAGKNKLAVIKNNQLYYYHLDRLSSVVAITDETGQVVWEGEYFAYGSMQSETGGDNSWKFTGQEKDDASGMYNFKFRYLDTGLEHFMTKDPVLSDFSPYAYCYGNPVNYVDYSGLDEGSGDEGYVYWSRKWNSWTYSGVTVTAKAPPGWEPPENRPGWEPPENRYGMDLTLDGRNAYNGNMWEYDQRYRSAGGAESGGTGSGSSSSSGGGSLGISDYFTTITAGKGIVKPIPFGPGEYQELDLISIPTLAGVSVDYYVGRQPLYDNIPQVEFTFAWRNLGIGINYWVDNMNNTHWNVGIHLGAGFGFLPVSLNFLNTSQIPQKR